MTTRKQLVLSAALATELFGDRDPIGRSVRFTSPFRGTQASFDVVGGYGGAASI